MWSCILWHRWWSWESMTGLSWTEARGRWWEVDRVDIPDSGLAFGSMDIALVLSAVNNRWTGLDWTGLEWKRSSATQAPNSVGLGWKMLSKNKYNFVALSFQLEGKSGTQTVRGTATDCSWSHVKIPWTTLLEMIVSNTDAVDHFIL